MSDKKITESMLKGLVEQVLSEKTLPIAMKSIDASGKEKDRSINDIKSDLGSKKIKISKDELKSLASKDNNEKEISLDDFRRSFSSAKAVDPVTAAPKAPGAQVAYNLMKDPGLDNDIKTDVETVYKATNAWKNYVDSRANFNDDPPSLKYNEKMPNQTSTDLTKGRGEQNKREMVALLANAATSSDHEEYLKRYITAKEEYARNALFIMKSLVQSGNLDKNNQFYVLAQKEYEKNQTSKLTAPTDRGTLGRKTITAPEISTQGIESGKMLSSQFHMFDKLLENTDGMTPKETLQKRIKKITEFSDELYKLNEAAAPTTSDKYLDFFNKTMIMDYINKMVFELDSMSGAYTFEAFCAYLTGGITGGKTKGLAGKMGATDFSFQNGDKGSAKYLKTLSEFKQSTGDFVINQPITYVFASKRDAKGLGASSPDDIHEIEMYVLEIKLTDETQTPHTFMINGTTKKVPEKEGSYIFKAQDSDSVGKLKLKTSSSELVTKNLSTLAENIGADVKSAFDSFKQTMSDLIKAKDNIEIYVQKGAIPDSEDANKDVATVASDKLKSANSNFEEVKSKISNAPPPAPVTESKKITSNLLKKLIEENFKK